MTNEQLATFIKQGGADDLTPALYERVKHLMYKLVGKYYSKFNERFNACGVELADFRQECYPAFIKALEAYSPDKGFAFTSYLEYHLRNAGAALLGIRNADRENNKPLDNCTSLDKPIDCKDGGLTLNDTLVDEMSEQAFECVINAIQDEQTRKVLHKALQQLDEPLRDVILLYYFKNMTFEQIGKIEGVSGTCIGHRKAKALRKLRCIPEIKMLREEQIVESRLHFNSRNYTRAYYQAQREINAILKRGDYLSYGKRQAIIYDCQIKQAIADNAEYQALCKIEQALA